mgnify:CR=1 FL=1
MLKQKSIKDLSNKKNIILTKDEQVQILFMVGQIAQISSNLKTICKNAGLDEWGSLDNSDAYTVADFEVDIRNDT